MENWLNPFVSDALPLSTAPIPLLSGRLDDLDDPAGDGCGVLLDDELAENLLERRYLHQVAQVFDRVVGHARALVDDDHPAAEFFGDLENMGRIEDRFIFQGQVVDDVLNHHGRCYIQAGEWLVEQEGLRGVEEGGGGEGFLPHP